MQNSHCLLGLVSHNHYFHISTHSGETPIFGSFLLWSLKAFALSHTGEKPLRFTPSLGSHALFLIFSYCFTRYRGLHCHWGRGGSAKVGVVRGRATQIQLVFPNFEGDEQNYCLLCLHIVVYQNTPKYSLNRWPSLKVHHWVIILRFLATIWFLESVRTYLKWCRQQVLQLMGKKLLLWKGPESGWSWSYQFYHQL